MTNEETSLRTKQMIAASLKSIMLKKEFSKITISEIIKSCNINRKTFYYHFEDINALLKWIFDQEAIEVVKNFDILKDFDQCINFVMDYVEENAHIINCAYDSLGREEMRRFLFNDFIEIVNDFLTRLEKENHMELEEDYKDFICVLYTDALACLIINYLKNRDKRSREQTILYLHTVIDCSIQPIFKDSPYRKKPQ